MKWIVFYTVLLFHQMAFSQKSDHVQGGTFLKRIEYNFIDEHGTANLLSKSIAEKILFGATNAYVEFVFESLDEVSAFRIVKNSTIGTYQLEIMQLDVDRLAMVKDNLLAESSKILIPGKLQGLISSQAMDSIRAHNKNVTDTYVDQLCKPYRPEPKIFKISDKLAETLQQKMALLIGGFKANSNPLLFFDGCTVTFRCVVESEVWTLVVCEPRARVLRLSDICLKIRRTLGAEMDESECLKLLDDVYFE